MGKTTFNFFPLAFIRYFGFKVKCPCCGGYFRGFLPAGIKLRPNAVCPACGSLERHRLLWIFLKEKTNFFSDSLRVLDVAPMPFLQSRWKKLSNLFYISTDISSPSAMVKTDLMFIGLGDDQFDCILCYHVLEHIPDDRQALRELLRIMNPGGWAIIQSALDPEREKTYEDPEVISPEDREKCFGQKDHMRVYGRDYEQRLRSIGFKVEIVDMVGSLDEKDIRKYGLIKSEKIFFCRKPEKHKS